MIFFALAGSLLLHLLPFIGALRKAPPSPRPTAAIEARLAPLPPQQPPLKLDEPTEAQDTPMPRDRHKKKARPEKQSPKPQNTADAPATSWTKTVRQHLEKLQKSGQFYPREAIARGIEGEVLVMLTIGPNGVVIAARVEQSSGFKLLDDAAVTAVRSIRSLPADAPSQAVLPVRFRLR